MEPSEERVGLGALLYNFITLLIVCLVCVIVITYSFARSIVLVIQYIKGAVCSKSMT